MKYKTLKYILPLSIFFLLFGVDKAFAASISASPSTITQNSTGNSIVLTGVSTSWTPGTPGTPTFTISGGTGASITSQTVGSGTSATLTISAGSSVSTLVITDPGSGATTSVSVTADVVAPVVNVTAPATGSTQYLTFNLTAVSSDNAAVTSVQFVRDLTTLVGASGATSPYTVSFDSSLISNGSHSFVAVAKDGAGNTSTSSAVVLTINNGLPVLTSTSYGTSGGSTPTPTPTPSTMTSSSSIAASSTGTLAPRSSFLAPAVGSIVPINAHSTPTNTMALSFSRDLKKGMSGDDVTLLQNYLSGQGFLKVPSTGYFGSYTKAALILYQGENGISPASGYFGPITRAYINSK